MKAFLPASLLLTGCLLGPGNALAADPPKPETLRMDLARVPRCSAEWKVERLTAPDTDMIKWKIRAFDGRIAKARPEQKAALEKERDSSVANFIKEQSLPLKVKLDYFAKDRYFSAFNFDTLQPPIRHELYANGSGSLILEEQDTRSLRMLPVGKLPLRTSALGLPEVALSELLEGTQDWKQGPQKAGFEIWTSEGRCGVVRVWIDEGTHQLARAQTGGASLSSAPADAADSIKREIEFKKYRIESGYLIPEMAVYQDDERREAWTLVRFAFEPAAEEMHSTQYLFKPGYQITDETGPTVKHLMSDDLLKGK